MNPLERTRAALAQAKAKREATKQERESNTVISSPSTTLLNSSASISSPNHSSSEPSIPPQSRALSTLGSSSAAAQSSSSAAAPDSRLLVPVSAASPSYSSAAAPNSRLLVRISAAAPSTLSNAIPASQQEKVPVIPLRRISNEVISSPSTTLLNSSASIPSPMNHSSSEPSIPPQSRALSTLGSSSLAAAQSSSSAAAPDSRLLVRISVAAPSTLSKSIPASQQEKVPVIRLRRISNEEGEAQYVLVKDIDEGQDVGQDVGQRRKLRRTRKDEGQDVGQRSKLRRTHKDEGEDVGQRSKLRRTRAKSIVLESSSDESTVTSTTALGSFDESAMSKFVSILVGCFSAFPIEQSCFKELLSWRKSLSVIVGGSSGKRKLWAIYTALVIQLMSYISYGMCRLIGTSRSKSALETDEFEQTRDAMTLLWYVFCGQKSGSNSKNKYAMAKLESGVIGDFCKQLDHHTGIPFFEDMSNTVWDKSPRIPERDHVQRLLSIQQFIVRMLKMELTMKEGNVEKKLDAVELLKFVISPTFMDVLGQRAFGPLDKLDDPTFKPATSNCLAILFDAVAIYLPLVETAENLQRHPFSPFAVSKGMKANFEPIELPLDGNEKQQRKWPDKDSIDTMKTFFQALDRTEYLEKIGLSQ